VFAAFQVGTATGIGLMSLVVRVNGMVPPSSQRMQ